VLLVTHDVDEAINLAERIVVIHEGKLIVDLQVDLSAHHGLARQARIVEVRKYLLASLGVQTDESPAFEESVAA
jgi:sulfonate transport system ATP-binding protein